MINILKNRAQILNNEHEYLVLNCGAYSPRLLAKIKRVKTTLGTKKSKKQIDYGY